MYDVELDNFFEFEEDECELMKQMSLFGDCTPLNNPVTPDSKEWQLFVDGASRNNPGQAGAGVYLLKNNEPVYKQGFYLGEKTNNQAEYHALLLGLYYCKQHMNSGDVLYIMSDSELLIKQMKGEYKVRQPHIKVLYDFAWRLIEGITYSFCHVPRRYNEEADALANEGIDAKMQVPHEFVKLLQRHGITL
jgi:ribonuclease HI